MLGSTSNDFGSNKTIKGRALQSSIISQASTQEPSIPTASNGNAQSVMSLAIVRGPLEAWKYEAILEQYNRLTMSRIPMEEFLHWVRDGVEGPAWHAVLENEKSEVVGHSAIIPFRGSCKGKRIVAGKAEYAFIREEYRSAKIRGLEHVGKPRNAVMIQQLFLRWEEEGHGPLLTSTSAVGRRLLSGVGCSVVKFPVMECLLILRPWDAARMTPNIEKWQRATLSAAGILQKTAWTMGGLLGHKPGRIREAPMGQPVRVEDNEQISFFEDAQSLGWRYLEGQYERLELDAKRDPYVVVKKGSAERYLRVCQWQLDEGEPSFQLIAKLVQMAREENALGVRWAVYGSGKVSTALSRRLRGLGFLCAQRERAVLIYSKEQDFHSVDKWKLTDAMFSFDP